jgi:undecaprenyl-phosphate galactose phosphotransferase
MLRRFRTKRVISYFLYDWLSTIGALIAATYLRIEIGQIPQLFVNLLQSLQIEPVLWWEGLRPEDILVVPVILLVAIIWPFFLIVFSVYDGRNNQTLKAEIANVFLAICVSTTTLAGLLYLTYRGTPRILFLTFFVLDVSLLLGLRVTHRLILRTRNGHQLNPNRVVVIIGAGALGRDVVRQLGKYSHSDIKLAGYLDDDPKKVNQLFEGYPVLGTLDQVEKIIQSMPIKDAIVALPLYAPQRLVEICQKLQDLSVQVHLVPDIRSLHSSRTSLDQFDKLPVISLGLPGIQGWHSYIKRAFDVIAVTIGGALIAPILIMITILIKLNSKGNVFFSQERIGRDGSHFKMWKFRTMVSNADQVLQKYLLEHPELQSEWEETQKLKNDPRITRIGSILRSTSMDELPQIWNVLRGEMSLIGPRPFLPSQVESYGENAYKDYISVRPGITGMWQVSGRNLTSFAKRAQWDEYYIKNWSFRLDLAILFRTFSTVVRRTGAY